MTRPVKVNVLIDTGHPGIRDPVMGALRIPGQFDRVVGIDVIDRGKLMSISVDERLLAIGYRLSAIGYRLSALSRKS